MAQATTWIRPDARQPEWDLTVVRPDAAAAADPSFGDLSEADLVAACLRGQNGAFDVIVERHRRAVYQLCYRFVGNHEDASDLSQDVFLRAYRGLRNFRGRSSLATWLYRIGVNVCLNRVSVKKPQSEPIDARQHVDTRTESPSERLMQRRACRSRSRGDRAAAAQAARGADPADVPRDVAPGNRGSGRQLGRRGQGERVSRACRT